MDKKEWFHREEVKAILRKVLNEGWKDRTPGKEDPVKGNAIRDAVAKRRWREKQAKDKPVKPAQPKKNS